MEGFSFMFQRIHPDAKIDKKILGDVGHDICSVETKCIKAWDKNIFSTGIKVSCDSQHYIRVAPRSGLCLNHSLHVGAGVIDSSYRGEIKVILFNLSGVDVEITKGTKIAQLIVEKINNLPSKEVDSLVETERGENGFGSTGLIA